MAAAEADFPNNSQESWFDCAVTLHSKVKWKSGDSCTDGLAPDSPNRIGQQFGYLTGIYFQLTSRIAYASSGEHRRFFADRASAVWVWSVNNLILNESDWTINSLVAGTNNDTACFILKDWRLRCCVYVQNGELAQQKSAPCHAPIILPLFHFSSSKFCKTLTRYVQTDTDLWKTRVEGLLDNTLTSFFTRNMIVEVGDLVDGLGAVEQAKYSTEAGKGFLALWLASVSKLMPEAADRIDAKLRTTAVTLAQQCGGSSNHTACGSDWTSSIYDDAPSFGNTLNVVNILVSNLIISKTAGSIADQSENGSGDGSKPNDTSTGGRDSGTISDGAIASAVVGSVSGAAIIIGAISWGLRKWKDQSYDAVRKDEPDKNEYTRGQQSDPAEHVNGHSRAADQVPRRLIQELPNNVIAELHEEVATTLSSNVPHELP